MADMVVVRKEGLYCVPGQFYIDPWRPVDRAVITHAHGDHARAGHGHYLAAASGFNILRSRLGDIRIDGLAYGECVEHNGVTISLHPAGHVLGSAQVRMEYQGEVWVASGDYKVEADRTCAPFEPVRCHTFITESTFGLPIYRWEPQQTVFDDMNAWWRKNAAEGRCSVVFAYAFGKAQRILSGLDPSIGAIVCHGAVEPLNRVYREGGVELPATVMVTELEKPALKSAIVIAPPSAAGSPWMKRFGDYSDAFASGWMQLRGARRRRGVDRGFVLSDHADWPGLMTAIRATEAQRVIVTHGSVPVMVRWLCQIGLDAAGFNTEYGDDEAENMREFARLYAELDETTATNRKLEALQNYFSSAAPENAAWAVYFLAGGKPRQAVPAKLLRQFAIEYAQLDEWLFDESYSAVGDMAETIAHILPPPVRRSDVGLAEWMQERIGPLRGADPEAIRAALFGFWDELDWRERFLLAKLIGGGFRVGVSKLLVTRALSAIAAVDSKLIAQRLMGWTDGTVRPTASGFLQLIAAQSDDEHKLRGGQPYPFFLAHQLQGAPGALGDVREWQVEWKYDGIRAQLVRRGGQNYLWSRGEDLITERFPELAALRLPEGTVIDGEVLIWAENGPAPFADLQKRIGRKSLSAKLLAELPAVLVAYDLLEENGVDLRALPQHERRALLETLVRDARQGALKTSPLIEASDWDALAAIREESRARGVEGMMLKARQAQYGVGRTKNVGTWWKWKIDPYSVDAVLIYAQAGHGRRASLYTDYTFAVWDDGKLVPFAKAYSGLTDAEIAEVDSAIRKTTVEKFGPVRSVKPTMVFEIGFEGIALSSRHKAGIAVRFPRILRRREDKAIEDADTLDTLKGLLAAAGA